MSAPIRIGAVSYLNTLPLVYGLERGLLDERAELRYEVPSRLADELAAGSLDMALLPVIELARIPDLEIVPGLGIVTRGDSRSVLLLSRQPIERLRSVALDPASRTSNALVRVLLDLQAGENGTAIDYRAGDPDLAVNLASHDAAVRIGDKALFETPPAGVEAHDLASIWTRTTGLPFVFAVWAAPPRMRRS